VSGTCSDADDPTEPGGDVQDAAIRVSPAAKCSVRPQGQGEARAGGDTDNLIQIGWGYQVRDVAVDPTADHTVGENRLRVVSADREILHDAEIPRGCRLTPGHKSPRSGTGSDDEPHGIRNRHAEVVRQVERVESGVVRSDRGEGQSEVRRPGDHFTVPLPLPVEGRGSRDRGFPFEGVAGVGQSPGFLLKNQGRGWKNRDPDRSTFCRTDRVCGK